VQAGIVETREAAYQAYIALGSNNISEILDRQFPVETKLEGEPPEPEELEAETPEEELPPEVPEGAEGAEEALGVERAKSRAREAMRVPFELAAELDRIEAAFQGAVQLRVIDPCPRRIQGTLDSLGDEAPREKTLTAFIRNRLQPDRTVLEEVLNEYGLRAANASGQAAINRIRQAIQAGSRRREAVRVTEQERLTLAERLARGEEWNARAGEFTFNLRAPDLLAEFRRRGTKIAGDVTHTMLQDLRDVLADQFYTQGLGPRAIAADIDAIFPRTYANRAENIARTEVVVAQGSICHETYVRNGIEQKEWIALLEGNTRAEHAGAHGQVRGINEPFSVGGEAMMHPGDPAASADNVCRCRCDELPVIDDDTELPVQPWLGEARAAPLGEGE